MTLFPSCRLGRRRHFVSEKGAALFSRWCVKIHSMKWFDEAQTRFLESCKGRIRHIQTWYVNAPCRRLLKSPIEHLKEGRREFDDFLACIKRRHLVCS